MASHDDGNTPARGLRYHIRDKIALLGALCAVPSGLAVPLGFVPGLPWPLELFTHFHNVYLAGLTVLMPLLVVLRLWRWAVVAGVGVVLNAGVVLPMYWGGDGAKAASNLRVLEANVLSSNRDHAALVTLLERERPDVWALVEASHEWIDAMAAIERDYPHSVKHPQRDNFGIALYSRFPFEEHEVIELEGGVPAIAVVVRVEGRPVRILAVHTLPPATLGYLEWRNAQMAEIARYARDGDVPCVVTGDLNAATWSPDFRAMLRESGLKDARRGFGIRPTWPAFAWPLAIPIDHCLVSPAIGVRDFRVADETGSDHLPLVVDLTIPAP